MKYTLLTILLGFNCTFLMPQIVLTIEGTVVNDTVTGTSNGVVIPRDSPTLFTYRNNSITSVNAIGYMLQAGDETPGVNNNNLDGALITGNRFIWNGTDLASMTHALFTGYNLDVVIKYNYLFNTPNGIQRKSNGMTDNNGVIAYNILINPKLGIAVKGINGIKIYNNTFYSEKNTTQTWRGLVDIHINTDGGLNALSTGTKVFNNIFYTRNKVININIQEVACLEDFESDYNVFWCEAGEPIFQIEGQLLTFTQWQAMGYDLHSFVINPNFTNMTDLVPRNRLDYGKDLGPNYQMGLSIETSWNNTDPRTVKQNGAWQVGARIYEASEEKIRIYPNPAYDNLFVLISDAELKYQYIKIFDLSGHLIMKASIDLGLNVIPIPDYFCQGIYNIAFEGINLKRVVKKIIIL